MNALKALFVMSVIVTVLVVVTLVQIAIMLLPYLIAALIVALILRWRRSGEPAEPGAPAMLTYPDPRPAYRIGAPASAPEGWVMVPVWIAPKRPGPNVIDAEVITGHD
jgi:hypothetical protein